MNTQRPSDATYVLGHPSREEERLQKLGQLLYPSTKHLFEQAGITSGMKVLDVGSGTGDVALLLAELVGPTGSIVGVDVYPAGLEVARARMHAAGLTNVSFLAGDIRSLDLDTDFDAVVGRNVLIYVADQSEVLRVCCNHLRPGGVVAFHEIEWAVSERAAGMATIPHLFQQVMTWIAGGFRHSGAEMQIGSKLPAAFLDAGLPLPQMRLDGIVGTTENWIGYDFLADVLHDILPKLCEYGILAEKLDIDSYIELIRAEAKQQRSFFPLFFMAGAWARFQE